MRNELNQYYRQIRRHLPCSRKQKQQIMDRFRQSVSNYREETPLADFSSIQAHFGTPEQIAHAYIAEMEIPEIARKFNIKKALISIVCASVVLALLLWALTLGAALVDNHRSEYGFYETSIMER